MSDVPADAREQFHRHAANYASSVPHSSGESLQILSHWASLQSYDLGLDIATGPGFTAFAIAPYCNQVVASDIADGMLEQARKIADERQIDNVSFEIIDAHSISYPDDAIDLVTCRTAPHHFQDIGKFLSEVHRVLKSTGVFLLSDTTTSENLHLADWHQRVELLRDPSHLTSPTPSQWRKLMAEAGFHITHEKASRVHLTFWDWVKRSGTPESVSDGLHRDFADASDDVKEEYGISEISDGDFGFQWPVFNCRALKN